MSSFKPALAACALALVSNHSFAADHLFPTDVVGAGEADMSLAWTKSILETPPSPFGNYRSDAVLESANLRFGLGHGLQVGAYVPYYSRLDLDAEFGGASIPLARDHGWWDPSFFVGAQLHDGGAEGVVVTATATVDTQLAGRSNWETYSADVTVASGSASGWRPYATLGYVSPQGGTEADSERIRIGAFHQIGSMLQFAPDIFAEYMNAPYSLWSSYGGRLKLIVRAGESSRIVPAVSYDHFDAVPVLGDGHVWSFGLSWYSLFGAN